jgi:hypothetical protein
VERKGEEMMVARKRRLCGSILTGHEPVETLEALMGAVLLKNYNFNCYLTTLSVDNVV